MAEELLLKSLKIKTQFLSLNHTSVADTYHNLAGIYKIFRKYNLAEELYIKALKIKTEQLGLNHLSVADT